MKQHLSVKKLNDYFTEVFPDNWIEKLDWSTQDKSKASLLSGLKTIKQIENNVFVEFAKIGLYSDHLRYNVGGLDDLSEKCAIDIVIDENNQVKASLQSNYKSFLDNVCNAILLAKHFCNITSEIFVVREKNSVINFLELESSREDSASWVLILDMIYEVCFFEYRFTYDEDQIRTLLINNERLKKAKNKASAGEVDSIISIAICKIDFLLRKLSYFAENKKIEYQYNFKTNVVSSEYAGADYIFKKRYAYFQKFIDPQKNITNEDVCKWCSDSRLKLGDIVLLMIYYTKVTQNVEQATNLLQVYEDFYRKKICKSIYEFNKYALRSVLGYMYNCLLSLKCRKHKKYSFDDLIVDMDKINVIQKECWIYNYHPYQKAIEYAIYSIKEDMGQKKEKKILEDKLSLLKKWQEIYNENIEWCKQYQCYAFQLSFNECTELNVMRNVKVFNPSSFCHPLKFSEICKKRDKLKYEIMQLEYQIEKYDDILALKEAQIKIGNMERKNMEIMGLFASVTAFLVGLLAIFIGNNGGVSILEKMHYVIVLGSILLLFVCLEYWAIGCSEKNVKFWIMLSFAIVLIAILGGYYYNLVAIENREKENMIDENSKPMNEKIGVDISKQFKAENDRQRQMLS